MSSDGNDHGPAQYASPACFLHETSPDYTGLKPEPGTAEEVHAWRKEMRAHLIAARLGLSADVRRAHSTAIANGLDRLLGDVAGKAISLYWPFRGEPDLRDWMASVAARGGTCLLPLVAGKGQPLTFRAWKAGEPLEKGVWNIPYPANGPEVTPDIVIAPVVGYDRSFYRLGYGGGFFDRTLAGFAPGPRTVGVGYSLQRLLTIYPQPLDIAMQAIITEEGIVEGRE